MFSGPSRGRSGVGGGYIPIELLDDGIAAEAFDVELGGGRRRTPQPAAGGPPPSRAWRIIAGVAVASVLVGGIVWLQGRGESTSDETAPTSTTAPEPSTTVKLGPRIVTTVAEAVPTEPVPTAPPTTIPDSFVINVGSPIVDLEGATSVFLMDENNFEKLFRLDQQTGVLERWEDPSGSTGVIVAMMGTAEAPRSVRIADSYVVARTNRDGTAWLSDQTTLRLIGLDGTTLRTIDPPWADTYGPWIDFVGTDADDNPVIAGLDGTTFTVRPDGTLARISESALLSVEHGNSSSLTCGADAVCQRRLTTSVGAIEVRLEEELNWEFSGQSFSPDGRWAIEETTDSSGTPIQWLANFEAGTRTQVDIGTQLFGNGGNGGPVYRATWTADSRHYVSRRQSGRFEDPNALTVLDVASGSVTEYLLPREFGAMIPIAVL